MSIDVDCVARFQISSFLTPTNHTKKLTLSVFANMVTGSRALHCLIIRNVFVTFIEFTGNSNCVKLQD